MVPAEMMRLPSDIDWKMIVALVIFFVVIVAFLFLSSGAHAQPNPPPTPLPTPRFECRPVRMQDDAGTPLSALIWCCEYVRTNYQGESRLPVNCVR